MEEELCSVCSDFLDYAALHGHDLSDLDAGDMIDYAHQLDRSAFQHVEEVFGYVLEAYGYDPVGDDEAEGEEADRPTSEEE